MTSVAGKSGHQQHDWLRFGVYGASHLWGPTWKVWQVPEGDAGTLAIGGRAIGGIFTFEHGSDGWVARFAANEAGATRPAANRGMQVDALPGGPAWMPGRTLLSITTNRQALTQPSLPRRFRYVAQIPMHLGMANETRVVAFGPGDATGVLGGWAGHGWMLLASLELAASLRVAVLYRSVPGKTTPRRSCGTTVVEAQRGAPGRETERPDALLHASRTDYPAISG